MRSRSSTPVTKPARAAPPALKGFAARIVVRLAETTRFVEPSLVAHWAEIVGPEVAALCRPGRITGGRQDRTIEVHASNGAAASRLRFEERAIVERLNTYFGPGGVGRLAILQSGGETGGAVKGLGRFRQA